MQLLKQLKSNLQLCGVIAFVLLVYCGVNYLILGKIQLCVWRAASGYPCPGCGLTHAGIFLLSGNIRESLAWNPFLIPIVLTWGIASVPSGWSKFADRFKKMKVFFILLIVATCSYFIYRLIVFYPQDPNVGPMFYDPCNYLELLLNLGRKLFRLIM